MSNPNARQELANRLALDARLAAAIGDQEAAAKLRAVMDDQYEKIRQKLNEPNPAGQREQKLEPEAT